MGRCGADLMFTFRSRYQFSTRPEPDKRKTRGQRETGQDSCSVVEPSRLTESRKRESCGCLASGEFGPARLISPTPPPPTHTHSFSTRLLSSREGSPPRRPQPLRSTLPPFPFRRRLQIQIARLATTQRSHELVFLPG